MKIPFHNRLFGYYVVKTEKRYQARFLNLLLRHRVIAYSLDECVWAVATLHMARVKRLAEEEGISTSVSALQGLPAFFLRYARRPGIILGMAVFLFILFAGNRHVWRVDVEGNEKIPEAVIEANLASLGFGVGAVYGDVDLIALTEEYRATYPDVSYMSIYMNGTVARVKVRETEGGGAEEKSNVPAQLVAERDAIVYRLEVSHGTAVVKVGQTVKKGELLVSGLVSGAHADTLLAAEGEVFGVVNETMTIEIFYEQTQKMAKEREKEEISLNFFGKTRKIFTNTGKNDQSYGTIEGEKIPYLPSGIPLPLSLSVTERVYYDETVTRIGTGEALRLAQAELKTRLGALVGEGELLGKDVTVLTREDRLVLECTVRYTQNIAVTLPMTEVPR